MKLLATATALCLGLACSGALANEPTEKDAIAMAERGAALIKSKGKDEMMKRINAKDPDFVQGELYVDMRDVKTGIVLAHPYNPSIVGKDLVDVPDESAALEVAALLPREFSVEVRSCPDVGATPR